MKKLQVGETPECLGVSHIASGVAKLVLIVPIVLGLVACGKTETGAKQDDAPKPTAKAKAGEVTDARFRYDGRVISYVAKAKNPSSSRLKAMSCIRFYDKDGFEIEHSSGGEVNLEPGGEDSITGKVFIKSDVVSQIVNSKLYLARFGCADSPAEAIGEVLTTKFELSSAMAARAKNVFEEAIDPFTGSREKWSTFKDEGGLNKVSDFYGLPVSSVNVSFKDDTSIKFFLLAVRKSVAPKDVRAALNVVCKTKETDWTKEDGYLTKGDAVNGNLTCSYLTNNESRNYDVSITVN